MSASVGARVISGLPTPRGPYPHVQIAAGLAFVSGTSARRPDGTIAGADVDEQGLATLDIRVQTRAVIRNLGIIVDQIGAGLDDLVQITTYLVSMDDFAGYNEVYGEFFRQDGPARTTVAVHQLPHPYLLIEMQAIAVLSSETPGRP